MGRRVDPDGTVILYPTHGRLAADVLCGQCRHGRYIEPHEPDLTKIIAAVWLDDHYKEWHPHWHRLERSDR